MTEADKILEKLGYKKIYEADDEVLYILYSHDGIDLGHLIFDKVHKAILFYHLFTLTLELLNAINLKVKELSWENTSETL